MPSYQFSQRKQMRLVTNLKVNYRLGSRSGSAYSLDLSAGGMFLQTVEAFTVGEWLELNFSVGVGNERRPVACIGQVLRIVAREQAAATGLLPGVGIEFRKFLQGLDDLRPFLANRLGVSLDEVGVPSFGPVPGSDVNAPRAEVRAPSVFPRRAPIDEPSIVPAAAAATPPAPVSPSHIPAATVQGAAAIRPAAASSPLAPAAPKPAVPVPPRAAMPDAEATFVPAPRPLAGAMHAPAAETRFPVQIEPTDYPLAVAPQAETGDGEPSDFDAMMAIAGRTAILVASLVVLSFALAQLRVTPWDLVPWGLLPWAPPR